MSVPNKESLIKNIMETINQSTQYDSTDIANAKKRVVLKLLTKIMDDIEYLNPQTIIDNPDLIDVDMLNIGSVWGNVLDIDIPPISIRINLANAIANAILHKKYNFIHLLLDKSINIYQLQPKIMIMFADTLCDDASSKEIFSKLISKKIPLHMENYRCVYQLASDGKLDFIKEILENYTFNTTIMEIVAKICVQACINNHVHIIEYFFTPDAFTGAPDQVFTFFINSIQYGGHKSISKFFIDNGVNIKQDNYYAVKVALEYNRCELLQYFYTIDPEIINLLSDNQQKQFGLVPLKKINEYIGLAAYCGIYYDDIAENDEYYQCCNKKHYYKEKAWNEWVCKNPSWKCPLCMCDIDRVIYVNKE